MMLSVQPEQLQNVINEKSDMREDIEDISLNERMCRKVKLVSIAKSLATPRPDSADSETRISSEFLQQIKAAGLEHNWEQLDMESLFQTI
jgi:hypothetical protein